MTNLPTDPYFPNSLTQQESVYGLQLCKVFRLSPNYNDSYIEACCHPLGGSDLLVKAKMELDSDDVFYSHYRFGCYDEDEQVSVYTAEWCNMGHYFDIEKAMREAPLIHRDIHGGKVFPYPARYEIANNTQ